MKVVGTVAPPPWVASGGRDPDNARLGIVERTIIGVNNVYFEIAASLQEQFWADHNATDVINHAIAENYRLHGVEPLRGAGYLPEAWMTPVREAMIVVVPARPHRDGYPMFDRLNTPANRGQWVIESALLAANGRIAGSTFDVSRDVALLLVHRNSPGLSGEVAALLTRLGEWDEDRKAIMKAARAVLKQVETDHGTDVPLALAAMPMLARFLPHEAHPLPPQRLLDLIDQADAQQAMTHVDMGPYLSATVRLANHDATTNPTKGTYRG